MDDLALLEQFEECTYPLEQWDHRTHVKLAFLYLREFPFELALEKLRVGLLKYNQEHQIEDGPFTGYNETTTHAFLRLVQTTMQVYEELFPTPDAASFCETHPQLLSKHILRLFYSPARRSHPDAKCKFLEPDLAPLPEVSNKV